jgi:endosialidase-like protein
MRIRTLLAAAAALTAVAASAHPARAQQTDTLYACYVPHTGNVYRIKTPDTFPDCTGPTHVEFSWKDIDLGIGGQYLLRLRAGSPLTDRFLVDSAGGVVASGQLGIGNIPATGEGYRMMWYPFKAAFRAGYDSGAGAWDDANIGFFSWAGGQNTEASAYAAFAFGDTHEVSGVGGVAFGVNNRVSGTIGFTSGANNHCTGFGCTAIGYTVRAGGQGAVALGYRVTASSDYGVALGHRATTAGHDGAFVWSDASSTDSLQANANNQFSIRASGGVRLFTNATMTTGVRLFPGSSAWSVISDRNRKENFLAVNGEDLLGRLRAVPVTTWNYIAQGTQVRHMGPMAQDFNAAFGLGEDPLYINSADLAGVTLAAVQALELRTAELAGKTREVEELKARVARLEALVEQIAKERQ